jgi:hypothetical protein
MMLRRLVAAGAMVMALTATAAAQLPMPGISLGHDDKPKLSPEELEKQKARDAAYNAAVKKIPEKKPTDPWGNIRDAGSTPPRSHPQ